MGTGQLLLIMDIEIINRKISTKDALSLTKKNMRRRSGDCMP